MKKSMIYLEDPEAGQVSKFGKPLIPYTPVTGAHLILYYSIIGTEKAIIDSWATPAFFATEYNGNVAISFYTHGLIHKGKVVVYFPIPTQKFVSGIFSPVILEGEFPQVTCLLYDESNKVKREIRVPHWELNQSLDIEIERGKWTEDEYLCRSLEDSKKNLKICEDRLEIARQTLENSLIDAIDVYEGDNH